MEKRKAAEALEDELMQIFDMTERIQCMLHDVMENFLCHHSQCTDREEYGRACTRLWVAQEATEKICDQLDKLMA